MTTRKLGYEQWAAGSITEMELLQASDGVRLGDRAWVDDEKTFYVCTSLTGGRAGFSKWDKSGVPAASTANGNMLYGLGGAWNQLTLGAAGQVLWSGGSAPYWASPDPAPGTAVGDLLYWGGSSWSALAPGTSGQLLKSNGTAPPSWGDSDVPSGGANGNILYHDGTGLTYLTPGTAGQVLQTNGAAAPSWANRDVPSGGNAGEVLYHDGTNLVYLGAGTSGQVLRSKGAAAPAWEDLRSELLDNDTTTKQVINTTTNTSLRTVTIPGGALTDGAVRWSLSGTWLNNTGSSYAPRLRIRIGSTLLLDITLYSLGSSATVRAWWLDFTIQANGTSTHKGGGYFAMSGYSDATVGYADQISNSLRTAISFATVTAEDNSSDLQCKVEWKMPVASTSLWIKRECSMMHLLRAA